MEYWQESTTSTVVLPISWAIIIKIGGIIFEQPLYAKAGTTSIKCLVCEKIVTKK